MREPRAFAELETKIGQEEKPAKKPAFEFKDDDEKADFIMDFYNNDYAADGFQTKKLGKGLYATNHHLGDPEAEPVVIEGDYEDAKAADVIKAIGRTAATIVFRGDEDLNGLITLKQVSGNGTRFLNVLYDASGDGTGYLTVKYQVSAQGVLSYTTEDLVSTTDPASPAEQTEE